MGLSKMPFQSSKSHTFLFAEAELYVSVYSLCGGGTSSQRIFHVWKRNCRISSHIIVYVRKRNFKSYNSLYVESLWLFMQESEVPGWAGPKAPVSKLSWRCCSQLCHLGGGPYWDCFSLLRSYQAWSNQLTCDKDPYIRQTSRPKTAGTKLPKGPIRRDEGDFLTLQEGPRSPWKRILTLSRALQKSRVLATHGLHIVLQYSSQ